MTNAEFKGLYDHLSEGVWTMNGELYDEEISVEVKGRTITFTCDGVTIKVTPGPIVQKKQLIWVREGKRRFLMSPVPKMLVALLCT